MEPGNPEQLMPQEGWHNETNTRRDSIISFLKEINRGSYNHITELHFSGHNLEINQNIFKGTAQVLEVNVLYEDGKEAQIHVVFDNESKGHNIDVYLKGKALEDYLNS